ncbi:Succinyl-CoA--L-malate CoA-transferase beta subunit [Tepidimonas sediminis]|uniref:Succinyl-CoA--L-malate CoA-transferase beta subunit n=1 Tax=Tepidimonas sediminis TaxID=2588941 RepID=A0A554WQV0_9BURK|nr:CoA transferase [Tepidimonas sediminis]TSE25950.1 Succinyl-CoA--L-malate CoA-transferase beta subunit [Tepidimonas sediminis]
MTNDTAAALPHPGPLAGVRVLELGQLIAGPFAARVLADFGADVIKIEPPGQGDPLRKWRLLRDGTSVWWEVQSRNKRSVCADLRTPEGQALVRRLAAEADVVIENFKPGTLEGWGLGWEQLHALNPRLIMLRVSGYGQTGPYAHKPGFAILGEAMGGLRHLTGEPGRVPVRCGVSIGDSIAALHGVIGVLLALYHRDAHGGQGQMVDVALYESVFNLMESLLPEYDAFGVVRQRSGSALPGIAPSNAYRCRADGDEAEPYVLIGGNGDGIFRRLMQAIGRPDLADDPELAHNDGRARRAAELDAAIEAWTRQRTVDEVIAALEAADVPVGRIYTAADIAHDPHYAARGMVVQATDREGRPLKVPGITPKLSATPGALRTPAPRLGEHGDAVARAGWGAA